MLGERVLWALFLLPTLIPETGAGVSLVEGLAIACHFTAAGSLITRYVKKGGSAPPTTWLLVLYLALSFVALTHDPFSYLLPYFAGGLVFTVATVMGGSVTHDVRERLPSWIFSFAALAATLDIFFDYAGWFARPALPIPIDDGRRGLHAAQSLSGTFLAPLAAVMVARPPGWVWRVLGAIAFVIVLFHVSVVGQGRGATLLAVLGALIIFARNLRTLPTVAVVLSLLVLLGLASGIERSMEPFMARVENQDLSDIDRIEHAHLGDRLLRSMSPDEIMTGMWYKKVLVATGGLTIHNAFFDVVTRFGVFATAPWVLFHVIALYAAIMSMTLGNLGRLEAAASVIVVQVILASFAAPLFINWRICVIPGLCSGLVLQTLRARDPR